MSAQDKNVDRRKPSKYAEDVLRADGRLKGLRSVVRPSGSIKSMLLLLEPLFPEIGMLNRQDKVMLKSALKTICHSYPEPVSSEREELVTLFEGAPPREAVALYLATLITVDHLTNKSASIVTDIDLGWYEREEKYLIAEWWRQILLDMLFLRPRIVEEDYDETIRTLQELDPIPVDRLRCSKTKSSVRQDRQPSDRQRPPR